VNSDERCGIGELGRSVQTASGNPNNPGIRPDAAVNSSTRYRAIDGTDPSFYIDARIVTIAGKSFVEASIETVRGSVRGSVSGKDFFAAMIAHFGLGNIDGTHARWYSGVGLDTNIDQFNQAVAVRGDTDLGRRTAALDDTWTGGRAKELGLSEVDVYFRDPLSAPYIEVKVKFGRL
jgi:hypothetical protein